MTTNLRTPRLRAVSVFCCSVLLATGAASAAATIQPAVAQASTNYWVEACAPSAGNVFSFSSNVSNLVGSDTGCAVSDQAGFAISDLSPGTTDPAGTIADWSVAAPPGETIQSLYYTGGSFAASGGGSIAGWQGANAASGGLNKSLDPDVGNDCNANTGASCNVPSNSETLSFGPGVGVQPLTEVGLAVACVGSPCAPGSDSASVGTASIELVDPNDNPTVDASVFTSNANDGYVSAESQLSLTYSAYDPGGVCGLEAELVGATGTPIAATDQGTVTPVQDSTNSAFTSTLPCGSSNTNAGNAASHTFAPSLAQLPSGTYYLEVRATNPGWVYQGGAGLPVVWQSSTLKLDNSTPTISLSTTSQTGTWYASPQQLTVGASDAAGSSGVGDVICTGPGAPGSGQPIAAAQLPYSITVPGSGAQTISCRAVSNSGVSSAIGSTTLDIDTQVPTTTLGGAASAPAVLASPQPVTVGASEPEAASGIASTTCTVTNAAGSPQTYTISGASGQLAAADFHNGRNVVSCHSTTNAGTAGQSTTETVEVDGQQPIVKFSGAASAPAWVSGDQHVVAAAAEPDPANGFGVESVSCQVDGGAWTSAIADHTSLRLSRTGTHELACYATSVAGVRGPTATETVRIDDAIPRAAQPVVSGGSTSTLGGWTRTSQRVTVRFTAAGGAPMKEVRCTLNRRKLVYMPGDAGVSMRAGGTGETVTISVRPPGGTLVCQGLDAAGTWSQPVSRSLRIDDTPPSGYFEPASRGDPTRVSALVTDSGSGVAGAVIEIDEHSGWRRLSTRYDRSTRIATAIVPDDGSIPDGTYGLRVDARDLAGNTALLDRTRRRQLESVTLPLRELTQLRAVLSIGSHQAAALTLAYGQGTRLAGELSTSRGAPIAGGSVLVEQLVNGSSRPTPVAKLRTDLSGGFAYSIPAGPTRTLELVYDGTKLLRAASATANLRVTGQAAVAVGHPIAGQQLTISGQLAGGWIPAGGALVQLWYEIRGEAAGWAPFERAIHTSASGSWQITFPVSPRAAGYTYEFKAVVSSQAGWPFLGATSAIVTRKVAA